MLVNSKKRLDIFWTNLDDFLNRKNIFPKTKIATLEFLVFWGAYISPVQEIVKIVSKNVQFLYNLVVWNLQYFIFNFITFLLLLQIFLQNNPLLQFELALLLCCISFKIVCRILDIGYSIKYRVRRQYHIMSWFRF